MIVDVSNAAVVGMDMYVRGWIDRLLVDAVVWMHAVQPQLAVGGQW
jgi:hypothetical protein